MILMSLDYLLFVIICLDPLDLHIQILRLGTKWCLPQRTGPIFLSRLTSSSLIVPTLPFGSRDLHPFREHFCIFGCVGFILDLGCDKGHL